jgi:formylmethanofuran--tetrahydromethanopterin N-formyltransferase
LDKIGKAPIEDTFVEAFSGIFCRVIVTADDEETLHKAVEDSTATPSVVVGRTEGGVEKYLKTETPDSQEI